MNKIIMSISAFLLLMLSTQTLAVSDVCVENCMDSYETEMEDLCFDDYENELKDHCINEYWDDYAADCIENAESDDGALYWDESDCMEDYQDTFKEQCLDDYEEEEKAYCLDTYNDEYKESCIDYYWDDLADSDGCCSAGYLWWDELDECISSDMAICFVEDGCPLDGDYKDGSCDGKYYDDMCYEPDEANCYDEDNYWSEGSCYEEEDDAECVASGGVIDDWGFCDEEDSEEGSADECASNGGTWANEKCFDDSEEAECSLICEDCWFDGFCYDSQDEVNCAKEDGTWIGTECVDQEESDCSVAQGKVWQDNQCYDSEEEAECAATCEDCWYDNICYSSVEEVNRFKCANEGKELMEDGRCVTEEEASCLRDEMDWVNGRCLRSEKAICSEQGKYWAQGKCYEDENQADCIADGNTWSEDDFICITSDDLERYLCENEGNYWINNDCFSSEEEGNCEENHWIDNECVPDGEKYDCVKDPGASWSETGHICSDSEEYDCKQTCEDCWYENYCYESPEEAECVMSARESGERSTSECLNDEDTNSVDDTSSCFSENECQEEEITCSREGGEWSSDLNKCYDSYAEKSCAENGKHWDVNTSECINDTRYSCIQDGMAWYANECVSWDLAVCEESGKYWSQQNETCYDNSAERNCVENEEYWSESQNACFGSEESACNASSKMWSDSYQECFDFSSEQALECFEEGKSWFESLSTCYGDYDKGSCIEEGYNWYVDECIESEDQFNCISSGRHWSEDSQTCFETEEELQCASLDGIYNNNECYESEEISSCTQQNLNYCDSSDSCISESAACCTSEDLYVEFDGTCASSNDEAECKNNLNYWSSDENECFTSEEAKECREVNRYWSDGLDTCVESQEAAQCISYGGNWTNDKCYFKQERADTDNPSVDTDETDTQADVNTDQNNNVGRENSDGIQYAKKIKNRYKLLTLKVLDIDDFFSVAYNPTASNYITPAKYSGDGEHFIAGIYSYNNMYLGNTEYSIFKTFDATKYYNFVPKVLTTAFLSDKYNSILLDWNYKDNNFYFLDKILNNKEDRFAIKKKSANDLNLSQINNNYKYKIDIDALDISSYVSYSKIIQKRKHKNKERIKYDLLLHPNFSKTSKLFQLNPKNPNEALVAVKKNSSKKGVDLNFRYADITQDKATYSSGLNLFANIGDNLKEEYLLPQNQYYVYSSNGEYLLSYLRSHNRFQIYPRDYEENNEFSIKVLENIIVEDNEIITSYSFDTKYDNETKLPLGIFYSTTSTDSNTANIYYLDISSETYFRLYSIDMGEDYFQIDYLEINPKKNDLLFHFCYGDDTGLEKTNEDKNYNRCYLKNLIFNRTKVDPILSVKDKKDIKEFEYKPWKRRNSYGRFFEKYPKVYKEKIIKPIVGGKKKIDYIFKKEPNLPKKKEPKPVIDDSQKNKGSFFKEDFSNQKKEIKPISNDDKSQDKGSFFKKDLNLSTEKEIKPIIDEKPVLDNEDNSGIFFKKDMDLFNKKEVKPIINDNKKDSSIFLKKDINLPKRIQQNLNLLRW